jgi:hypothetical protein
MAEDSNKTWATIGKIGVVIAIIVGLITIYKNVFADGPSLFAQGASHSIHYSPRTFDSISVSDFDVSLALPYDLANRDNVSKEISNAINQRLISQVRSIKATQSDGYMVEINITNDGNRDAQNVRIEIPTSGVYEVGRAGEPVKVEDFSDVVPVGNIGPSNTVSVIVWTKYFSDYLGDKVKITHSLGTAGVEFAIGINGKSALPYRYPTITVLVLLLVGFVVYQVGFFIGFWTKGKRVRIPFLEVNVPESATPQSIPDASQGQNTLATNSTEGKEPRDNENIASPS